VTRRRRRPFRGLRYCLIRASVGGAAGRKGKGQRKEYLASIF
jgi:hypothetical protein